LLREPSGVLSIPSTNKAPYVRGIIDGTPPLVVLYNKTQSNEHSKYPTFFSPDEGSI